MEAVQGSAVEGEKKEKEMWGETINNEQRSETWCS